MKHIYILNTDSHAGDYGIGTYLRELIACINSESGVRLTVVELQSAEKELSVTEVDGMRQIKIPSPKILPYWQFHSKKMALYNLTVCCLLKKYVNPEEENVFHLNYLQHDSLVQYLRKLTSSCRIIFTIHYIGWYSQIKGNRSYFKEIIHKEENERRDATEKSVYGDYMKMKAMCQSVDKVICLSSHTFDMLLAEYEIPKEQLAFIPNGLQDEAKILNEEQKRTFKRELAFNEDEKVVLFVGRLDEAKGLLPLLRAFKKVIVHSPDAHLIIAGSGNYDEFLKECPSLYGKVSFTGKVKKDFLYRLYQITDVGVHPSLNEQCSYVAIEMMMHGIPLIGFDSIGIGEMIESGYNGYKVHVEQEFLPASEQSSLIRQLGDRLIEILHNSELRQKLRKNSRAVYESQYRGIKMKHKILGIYFK